MSQVDGVLAARHADVDVLPEHGELLGEVAVERGDPLEALRREDAPLRPAVERMRAAAGDRDVEPLGGDHDGVAHAHELGQELAVASVHRGIDLDHALGDLGLHLAVEVHLLEAREQIGRAPHEVEVVRIEHHQLELDAEGERFRRREFQGHQLSWATAPGLAGASALERPPGSVSPARRKPHCTAIGPAISMTITAAATEAASSGTNPGYCWTT